MIDYVCCCIPKRSGGIVPKAYDSGTRNIQRKEVFEPERFGARLSPCFRWITVQSVDSDDTMRQVESVLCCLCQLPAFVYRADHHVTYLTSAEDIQSARDDCLNGLEAPQR